MLHAPIPARRFSEQKQALADALNQSLVPLEAAVHQSAVPLPLATDT